MTDKEWHASLERIAARAELTEMAKTFRGPGEACLAYLVAAHACAEFLPGFDIIDALRRLDDELKKRLQQ